MQIAQRFWKRSGYVSIEMENGRFQNFGGDQDALDFRFDGRKLGDIQNEFTVGILGLSTAHINTLTVWNVAEAFKRFRKIKVYAGYSVDSIASPIFEGIVTEAIPSSPPDKWLNFKCLWVGPQADPSIKQETVEKKPKEIFEQLAKNLALTPKWKVTSVDADKKIKFTIDQKPQKAVERFAEAMHIKCYKEHDLLYAIDDKGWYQSPHDAKKISIDTGLINIPFIDIAGATIRTRLIDDLDICSWIKLESSLIPSANGYYYAIEKHLVGHLRGEEWYTEFTTVRAKT